MPPTPSSLKTKRPLPSSTSNGHRRQHMEVRKKLPVYQFRKEICELVYQNEVVLVVAETGSGKS